MCSLFCVCEPVCACVHDPPVNDKSEQLESSLRGPSAGQLGHRAELPLGVKNRRWPGSGRLKLDRPRVKEQLLGRPMAGGVSAYVCDHREYLLRIAAGQTWRCRATAATGESPWVLRFTGSRNLQQNSVPRIYVYLWMFTMHYNFSSIRY